jgi:hypothetical protein
LFALLAQKPWSHYPNAARREIPEAAFLDSAFLIPIIVSLALPQLQAEGSLR